MRKSSNRPADVLAPIILWGAIVSAIISRAYSNPFILILAFVAGGLAISAGLWFLKIMFCSVIASFREKIRVTKAAKELCPHGVIGGRARPKINPIRNRRRMAALPFFGGGRMPLESVPTIKHQLKCAQCEQNERETERKEQLEKLRQQATEKVRAEADGLQVEEYTRLTKLRTHKIDFLLRLPPEEFEEIVGDMYRRFGYLVERTPMSNDYGRDLILKRDGKTGFVECKRYDKDMSIGRRPLQQFYGTMVNMKADFGIFVTTSYFAKTAVAFAGETDIQLVDGYALADLMAKAFPGEGNMDEYRALCRECGDLIIFNLRDPVAEIICRNGHSVRNDAPDSLKIRLIAETPVCEKCGSKMRVVSGRFGKFWGCSNYPNCKNKKRFLVH